MPGPQGDATVDPKAMRRVRTALVAVLVPMAVWAGLSGFLDVWPGPRVRDLLGTDSIRAVFAAWFVGQGLVLLAVLIPVALVVSLVRRARAR